jgi:hypothetical protein
MNTRSSFCVSVCGEGGGAGGVDMLSITELLHTR